MKYGQRNWGIEFLIYFLKAFIYLFMRDTGRQGHRGKSRFPAGTLMQDWIPGPQDHDLSQRQVLNHWATQVPQGNGILI